MEEQEQRSVRVYADLAQQLLAGTLPIPEFERRFFASWGGDPTRRSHATFQVLERFFFVVEDYVDDDSLREPDEGDLDADQLRAGAQRFLDELARL